MATAPYELVPEPGGVLARINVRGSAVLASPSINRGTAFSLDEREALGLDGLLPSGVTTLEGQVRRVYVQYLEQANPLRKWVYLANLRDRNEVLFYRLLTDLSFAVMRRQRRRPVRSRGICGGRVELRQRL